MMSLVYSSSAIGHISEAELHEMLERARHTNERLGITGMLLYKGGNFMQLLEGDDASVQAVFERIRTDPRHDFIVTLLRGPTRARQFPGWPMGFNSLDEAGSSTAADPGDAPAVGDFPAEPGRALKLLLSFRAKMQ